MSKAEPIPTADLEESAQGQDLYRAPGADSMIDQAREQAEASGWLPPQMAHDWPSTQMRREINHRRQRLYEAMQGLETAAARASRQPDWGTQIEQACLHLEKALVDHVSETEAVDGLFASVVAEAPRLSAAVNDLRADHEVLQRSCARLLAYVASKETDPAEMRRRILATLGRLAQHRQRGAELLFDAYNVDIAAGD